MSGGVEHLILSGPVLLAIPVAAAAGAVTFLSPCCLPLVPGYLSYLTGMSGAAAARREEAEDVPTAALVAAGPAGTAPAGTAPAEPAPAAAAPTGTAPADPVAALPGPVATAGAPPARSRIVLGTLLFILGFSALFALEGVTAASIGDALLRHREGMAQLLGGLIILLGLLFIGLFDRFSFAGRIVKPSVRPRAGLAGAPLLGVLFGLGWTPCSGPTLSAVLLLGSTSGTALRGGLLAFVYALGIGIPFLVVALGFSRGATMFGFARRHARLITRIGGVLLIAVGVLEVTGAWQSAITWLQVHWLSGYTTSL
ncbi:MAG TPA: cytochrome c biogenesis CcdA family protein [Streptosporangiaceae bacterium]|nr:cytochrome c biogenesis CcdA family protein [Streptosporangiaceae bacterium]